MPGRACSPGLLYGNPSTGAAGGVFHSGPGSMARGRELDRQLQGVEVALLVAYATVVLSGSGRGGWRW